MMLTKRDNALQRSPLNHYRQLNTEIYGIYTGLSETIYYTQRLFS